jgi:hypothetical protein
MRRRRPWIAVLAAAGLTLLGGSALAYFTSGGLGTASAAVTALSVPTITAATPSSGGSVALAWTSVGAPGPEAVKYYVTRDGGSPGGNCAAPNVPAATTTCNDAGASVGTHSYTVTAVWRSWSATGAVKAATVTVGEATHFTLSASTTTPAANAAVNLTITAKDEKENTVTAYLGSHPLAFSGATSSPSGSAPTVVDDSGAVVAFGSATAITFTAGVATVASAKNGVMKLYRAGSTSIAAGEVGRSITTTAPLALTVSALTATKYALTASTATPAAGGATNLTITAQDTYGNTATSYTGSHSLVFSGASASPGGTQPTVSNSSGTDVAFGGATAIAFSAGVAAASGVSNGKMTIYRSGAAAITAAEGATITTPTALAVTVAAGPAGKLVLGATTTAPVAAATDDLTLTAQDAYANTASAYAGARNITFSGASASPSGAAATVVNSEGGAIAFGSATSLTFTAGVAAVAAAKNGVMTLNKAGATSVSASDGTISTATPLALTVAAGAATRLAMSGLTASAGTVGSPCLFACTIAKLGNSGTVSANLAVTDSVGNTVSNLGSGHTVKVTTTIGALAEATLTIAATGSAMSATRFTFTAPSNGNYSATITAASLAGTVYTSATASPGK